MNEVIARTLDRRVHLRTTEREVHEAVRYLDCTPEIVGHPASDLVMTVERYRGRYRIVEDGRPVKEALALKPIVDHLHARLFAISISERPQAPLLHAASLRRNGRRILLLGSRGAGKTTFALHLARAGYRVEGDEHVFVIGEGVIARPRACRVKDSSLVLLADIAETIAAAPFFTDYLGCKTFNVDPRAVGAEWQIEHGPVDYVIVLQPNHGGYSSIRPLKPLALAQMLVAEAGMPETGRGRAVVAIAALAARAKGFDLSHGDHAQSMWCVDRLMGA